MDKRVEGWKEGVPNPGSFAAYKLGCQCPFMDNHYGRGYRDYPEKPEEKRIWVTTEICEMHWVFGGSDGD